MKLFVDEDTGSGIAKALRLVDVPDVAHIGKKRRFQPSAKDWQWLPYVGEHRYLALSRDKAIVLGPAQRLVVKNNVGIVILPQHLIALDLLRLILRRWAWLNNIDANTPRPFAYFVAPTGHVRQHKLREYPSLL